MCMCEAGIDPLRHEMKLNEINKSNLKYKEKKSEEVIVDSMKF